MKPSLDVTSSPIQIVSIPPSNRPIHHLLLRLSKANGSLAEVINGVPLSQEGITKNGKWAYGLGEILEFISLVKNS